METTNWSITTQWDWFTVQNMLFTYNEEEQLENKINKEQAWLLLHVDFVPLYPSLLKEGYGLMEAVLLGYIKFFLNWTDNRFYCTNEQLAELFNCSERTISTAIKSLEDRWDIVLHKKIRAWWWLVRFVTLQSAKFALWEMQNLHWINNKIIKNKKEIYKEKKSTSVSELVEACMNDERINTVFAREDIEEWLNYKERKKQQYSTVKSCIQQLVIAKRQITLGQPKLDISKRFNFAVNYAIGKWRDGIHWYEDTEKEYLATKKDFYPNPNLDEQ